MKDMFTTSPLADSDMDCSVLYSSCAYPLAAPDSNKIYLTGSGKDAILYAKTDISAGYAFIICVKCILNSNSAFATY